MKRYEILETAAKIVTGGKNKQYGEPEDSFEVIAGLWNSYVESACSEAAVISIKGVPAWKR